MKTNIIYNEDCLGKKGMRILPNNSINMILADVPYGRTACKWDKIIPLEPMWKQLKRVIKSNGAIVMTASQPFTSMLVMSNLRMFKYEWIWKKGNKPTNFLNVKKQPLRITEDILVFYKEQCTYNPQMFKGQLCHKRGSGGKPLNHQTDNYGKYKKTETIGNLKYPQNLIDIPRDSEKLHPTQKPIALFEYLIKTYTNEGDIVLDFAMGSGTTAVACVHLKRHYIGFETGKKYWHQSIERLEAEKTLWD